MNKYKLIKVEREISIYKKGGSESIEDISVDTIPFDALKKIVLPKEDDPLLYDGYVLNNEQVNLLNALIEQKIVPNSELYDYILVCNGIYDWETK